MAAALALPVTGVAVAGLPGVASAGTPKVTVVCTSVVGTASGSLTVSGCTGGNTGGGAFVPSALSLATGGTITWNSGATTTTGTPVLTVVSAKKCPGYVKNATSGNPTAEKFSLTVTGGSGSNMPVNGTSSGEICLSSAGNITALKPLKTKGQI